MHGDGEAPRPRLRQTPAGVGLDRRRPARAPARTPRRPSRRATPPPGPPRRRRAARGSAGRAPPHPAGGTPSTAASHGVRAEQAAAHRRPALVGVEGGGHACVERIGRASARPGRRRRASAAPGTRPGADVDQARQLVAGHQVEQRRGGDRPAPARSSGRSRVMSDRLVSTTTEAPSAAGPGRSAAATCSSSASRSCSTQCCGPGSERREPAAHRPGAAAEVVDHHGGRSAGSARPRRGRRVAGAGRGVGRLAQLEPRGADPDALGRHRRRGRPGRRRRPTVVADQPASDARRSRAARRSRRRSSASPSQARSAAPSATRVVGRHEQPGPVAVGAVAEGLRHAPDLGRDDRQAAGERLGDHHAVRLGARRAAPAGPRRRSCASSSAPVRGPAKRTRSPSPPSRARRRRPSANAGSRSRLPTHRQCHDRSAIVASASSSTSWPLPGITAATQSSAPRRPESRVPRSAASTPGSATCTRSPASEYRSSSAPPRPAAGRDDGRRRPRSTARSRVRAPSSAASMAQRHVHEHDQPQPARLRHEHLRGRRGDQPVEQHDGAVGDLPDGVGEGGDGRPRPAAATSPARRARAPTSRSRRARRRPGGRRRCRRSAGPGRRCRPGRRRALRSQRPLVARPGDVRLVQRDGERRRAPGRRRPGRRRARARRAGRRSPGPAPPSWCSCPRTPARRRGCGS